VFCRVNVVKFKFPVLDSSMLLCFRFVELSVRREILDTNCFVYEEYGALKFVN
jgi:hypothetical protein